MSFGLKMKLIKLKWKNAFSEPIDLYIELSKIQAFYRHDGCTIIQLDTHSYNVSETPEEIITQLVR